MAAVPPQCRRIAADMFDTLTKGDVLLADRAYDSDWTCNGLVPIALIRHIAALRPGAIISAVASAKAAMNALARRWLMLHDEIRGHDSGGMTRNWKS